MLHDADIVISDLTELNPNVFYELGIRQATKGKCINIMLESEFISLPFDLRHLRIVIYKYKSPDHELDGIEAYFRRANSTFSQFKNFSRNLEKMPKDEQYTFFKLDRQARVLITEDTSGNVQTIIVQNPGENQTCFLIEGPKAKEYLQACIDVIVKSCAYL